MSVNRFLHTENDHSTSTEVAGVYFIVVRPAGERFSPADGTPNVGDYVTALSARIPELIPSLERSFVLVMSQWHQIK